MKLSFGTNLKRLRRQRDMTQGDLADALTLSVQAISRYEMGSAYPDIEMLPVIAGYFGITVDDLLGVSKANSEKRMDEYLQMLLRTADRAERLAILRRQHVEFPDDWSVVSDMMYEMTFLPDRKDELRELADDAMKRCAEPLWRENMMFWYLRGEDDEGKALAFIDKYSSRYDITKPQNLANYYNWHGNKEKHRPLEQYKLRNDLKSALTQLSGYSGSIEESIINCRHALDFITKISGNDNIRRPDLWIDTRLAIMLRLANNYISSGDVDEGFCILDDLVALFENFFALPDETVLSYGNVKLDCLNAKTYKNVYYHATDIIATSMMVDLKYETPIASVTDDKVIRDMDSFEREYVFSSHTYDIFKAASWAGFARVKDDERYIALLERVKNVSLMYNIDNLFLMLRKQAARTDDYVKDAEWYCTFTVKGAGVYSAFDTCDDNGKHSLDNIVERMKREGNTHVCRVAAVKFGGWLTEPPVEVVKALIKLDASNADAEVLTEGADGEVEYHTLSEYAL